MCQETRPVVLLAESHVINAWILDHVLWVKQVIPAEAELGFISEARRGFRNQNQELVT